MVSILNAVCVREGPTLSHGLIHVLPVLAHWWLVGAFSLPRSSNLLLSS